MSNLLRSTTKNSFRQFRLSYSRLSDVALLSRTTPCSYQLSSSSSLHSNVPSFYQAKCSYQPRNRSQPKTIEGIIKKIDTEARRNGRIPLREVEEVFEGIKSTKSASEANCLMVIRCCGNLLSEEPPYKRSQLLQDVWKTFDKLVALDILSTKRDFPIGPHYFWPLAHKSNSVYLKSPLYGFTTIPTLTNPVGICRFFSTTHIRTLPRNMNITDSELKKLNNKIALESAEDARPHDEDTRIDALLKQIRKTLKVEQQNELYCQIFTAALSRGVLEKFLRHVLIKEGYVSENPSRKQIECGFEEFLKSDTKLAKEYKNLIPDSLTDEEVTKISGRAFIRLSAVIHDALDSFLKKRTFENVQLFKISTKLTEKENIIIDAMAKLLLSLQDNS